MARPAVAPTSRNDNAGVYVSLAELVRARHGAKDINIFKPQLAKSMLLGDVRSRFRGRGMEFEEVRPYQPGDDIRAIDWRVTARTGTTHTKLFAEERERPVHRVVDQRSPMFFGSGDRFKSVMAAELGALISWAALGGSDRIGGQVAGDTSQSGVRAKRTRQAVMQLLNQIAKYNQMLPSDPSLNARGDRVTLSEILEEAKRVVRPGTALFILSDFHDLDDVCRRTLTSLGKHSDLSLFRITDPLEDDFDIHGRLGISDGAQTQSVNVHEGLRGEYRQIREREANELTQTARQAKARLVDASTALDPITCITRLYKANRS